MICAQKETPRWEGSVMFWDDWGNGENNNFNWSVTSILFLFQIKGLSIMITDLRKPLKLLNFQHAAKVCKFSYGLIRHDRFDFHIGQYTHCKASIHEWHRLTGTPSTVSLWICGWHCYKCVDVIVKGVLLATRLHPPIFLWIWTAAKCFEPHSVVQSKRTCI